MTAKISKDQHCLTSSDLDPSSTMNYKAGKRLSSPKVSTCLKQNVENSAGTIAYVEIMQQLYELCESSLTSTERLRKWWFICFFVRGWRNWLIKIKKPLKHFISSNTYECIELNAHSYIAALINCRDQYEGKYFLPEYHNSQSCESYFRTARSLSTTQSTVINFTMRDFLQKAKRINTQEILSFKIKNEIILPRMKDQPQTPQIDVLPSNDVIEKIICISRQDALKKLSELGMQTINFKMDRLLPSKSNLETGVDDEDDESTGDQILELANEDDQESENDIRKIMKTVGTTLCLTDFSSIKGKS